MRLAFARSLALHRAALTLTAALAGCVIRHETRVGDAGAETAAACDGGGTRCGTTCVDTRASATHCGRCGNACPAGTTCTNGACACGGGQQRCDGACVDLAASALHCGRCNTPCTNGTVCATGHCETRCAAGQTDCNGACFDTQTEAAHCGACDRACAAGMECVAGACACPAGQLLCGGACRAIATDAANCGECGRVCTAPANAAAACAAGACAFVCDADHGDCDSSRSNGCETDLRTDEDHCGTCATACRNGDHGSARCVARVCGIACDSDRGDCDGDLSNGCETDLRSSATHCGACDAPCAARANATARCDSRMCNYDCATNFGDCDTNRANGCETDLRTTAAHCRVCNNRCLDGINATGVCVDSACEIACTAGHGNCDGQGLTGCETNLLMASDHCGDCATACGPAASCANGRCM